MDSRTMRLAVLLSITAVILILLVVYASNAGNIRRMSRSNEAATGATDPAVTEAQEQADAAEGLHEIGDGFVAYGEQIGNQPKAFLYDENFFDPMRDIGQGITDGDEEPLTMQAAVTDGVIHVSILNSRGGLEGGVAFQVVSEQVQGKKSQKTWTDTDRDGQVDITGLSSGSYRLHLLEVRGYTVPEAPVVVRVDLPMAGSTESAADAQTGATGASGAETGSSAGAAEASTGTTGDPAATGNTGAGAGSTDAGASATNGSGAAGSGSTMQPPTGTTEETGPPSDAAGSWAEQEGAYGT